MTNVETGPGWSMHQWLCPEVMEETPMQALAASIPFYRSNPSPASCVSGDMRCSKSADDSVKEPPKPRKVWNPEHLLGMLKKHTRHIATQQCTWAPIPKFNLPRKDSNAEMLFFGSWCIKSGARIQKENKTFWDIRKKAVQMPHWVS